jgi:Zn finger protein HypA/HybF involved in hydrogenase expression
MGRIAKCRDCNHSIRTDIDIEKCPKCGSKEITYSFKISNKINIGESLDGKSTPKNYNTN